MTATSPDATDATPIGNGWLTILDREAEARGFTSEPAKADLIGVSRETLWRYRKGHLTPSLERAKNIAAVLGITVDELIGAS